MSSLTMKTAERLMRELVLVNATMPRGQYITPLLVGAAGIGKSSLIHELGNKLSAPVLIIDGSLLKEGETTMPIPYKNEKGNMEVNYIYHYVFSTVQEMEHYYYSILKTKGFLGGDLHLDKNDNLVYKFKDGHEFISSALTEEEVVLRGDINKYEFGEDLPSEAKLRLLESGEIKPVVLFIDEMNRTENQTMKELMNIVLTKTVNSYRLPWWCFMTAAINPCGQDSLYSTNEMDPAQKDRFLSLNVGADFDEWVDWAMDNEINQDYIIALGTCSDIFTKKGKGYEESDNSDQIPTPRSHTACAYIYNSKELIMNSKFFTQEELRDLNDDIRELIIGKIGRHAGNIIIKALANKENYIDPKDILTGKSKTINEKVLEKIQRLKPIALRILMKNIGLYISKTLAKTFYDQKSKNNDVATNARTSWSNAMAQLKELVSNLDSATQLIFAKDSISTSLNITEKEYEKYNNTMLFKLIATSFSLDIIQQCSMTNKAIENGDIDKK